LRWVTFCGRPSQAGALSRLRASWRPRRRKGREGWGGAAEGAASARTQPLRFTSIPTSISRLPSYLSFPNDAGVERCLERIV
jgi:hypothetical protein